MLAQIDCDIEKCVILECMNDDNREQLVLKTSKPFKMLV